MDGWTPAKDRPGYRCKTVQRGPATIVIYRPILGEEEAAKATATVRTGLESALRIHTARTQRARAC